MKVAISVPDPVFAAAEHLAKELKVSRSQLYSEALSQYVGAKGRAAVTSKLNEVYGANDSKLDPALMRAQVGSLRNEAW